MLMLLEALEDHEVSGVLEGPWGCLCPSEVAGNRTSNSIRRFVGEIQSVNWLGGPDLDRLVFITASVAIVNNPSCTGLVGKCLHIASVHPGVPA